MKDLDNLLDSLNVLMSYAAPGCSFELRSSQGSSQAKVTLHSAYSRVGGPSWTGTGDSLSEAMRAALRSRAEYLAEQAENPRPSREYSRRQPYQIR